jgi:general secretion pathway protein J
MSEAGKGAEALRRPTAERSSVAGFTLMEAMLALALMAAIVMALATISAQWLPNWRRGFVELQRADLLSLGLERMAADISAAEFVTPNGVAEEPLFEGRESSVTFVRTAFGPDTHPHLEVVRLAEAHDDRGFAIVRTRAPFTPMPLGATIASQYAFADPVVLTRTPFRISFGYAGPARTWLPSWGPDKKLPNAVRISVRDANNVLLAASTATPLKITANGVLAASTPPAAPDQPQQPDASGASPTPEPAMPQQSQ